MSSDQTQSVRIEAEIPPDAWAIVERAAELQGQSVGDFVFAAAHEAAHRMVEESDLIRLTPEAQRQVADLLLDPPSIAPALDRAAEAHDRLFRKAR